MRTRTISTPSAAGLSQDYFRGSGVCVCGPTIMVTHCKVTCCVVLCDVIDVCVTLCNLFLFPFFKGM